MIKRVIFITENVNKYKELQNYLQMQNNNSNSNVRLELIKPEAELHEIQSLNQEEIVLHKLHDAFQACHHYLTYHPNPDSVNNEEVWILVEDTSLCISRLGGFPGPFVKFFLQSIPLENIGNENWGSEAQSIVNLAIGRISNNGNVGFSATHCFNGIIDGYIVNARGENGFGFDPIFRPVKSDKTNAEMSMEDKADFNPRILAFQKVLDYLQVQV